MEEIILTREQLNYILHLILAQKQHIKDLQKINDERCKSSLVYLDTIQRLATSKKIIEPVNP